MIKKVFKTVLVLSLCLGITLPTNAAVSVSDGSAFVTKAEFAADLNNLSNRMAQLENSLDAKIDSLVSSYLTRNGIWNGAKQDIVGTSGSLVIRYGFSRGSMIRSRTMNFWVRHNASLTRETGDGGDMVSIEDTAYINLYNGSNTSYNLIDNINKSGMLVLSTSIGQYFVSSTTRCVFGRTPDTSSTQTANGDHFVFTYAQDFIFYINDTVEGVRAHTELSLGASPTAFRCSQIPVGTVLFFVSKGDRITVKDEPVFINGDGSGYAASLLWFSFYDNAYSQYEYVINSAYVY